MLLSPMYSINQKLMQCRYRQTIDIKNIFLNPYPDYVVLILMTLYAVTFVLFVNKQTVIIKAFDYAKSLIEVCERI